MSNQTQTPETPPTKEEMEAKQAELQSYYERQIPFLNTQLAYQTLITELEELDVRRAMAMVRLSQIIAPPPKQSFLEEDDQPRKLKKEA
jgi:hypothetical protein